MRQELYNEKYGLAYGQDHAVGKFIQVWRLNPKYPRGHFENMPDGSNVIVDLDEMGGALSVKTIVETAARYGFHLEHELPEEEIQYE